MRAIRVHTIAFAVDDMSDHCVMDWRLKLPEDIQDEDAQLIGYVFVFLEDWSGEIYKVKEWNRKLITHKHPERSEWTLELGSTRRLSKEAARSLMDTYVDGTDLDDTRLKRIEDALQDGQKAPDRFDEAGLKTHSMSFKEAKTALASFYSVDAEQIQIRITG
ncbi:MULTISPECIES: hypothetical protein [Pseudomonas syringae group genomosp. 2]|uniref:Uncharacterized protein n=3 Tax=Pseudomonas syringae group genomosp. 2 TaxID=251698 RepID=A0AAX1VSR6_PSEAJ|nr:MULTISPECIES: hypothetical protein [Pseudomonas syringae group genomosp. 2]KPX58375.1 hypothetical protein ALO35_102695 [Pseudomonas amygdali pv. lachrymans]KEZ27501.1 hypothetical protein A3SK_0109470 [Pseudomonas amygdali pv. tabaci str. 6605]KEZ64605.1 hypothetical protein C1E_0226335 [Pseudomonas amygdali pv. tabaci str. ATCC 11528]KIY19337.1 hypothetical protein RD00_07330 [Pseudomonas amygdali pv. tabaci]KPY82340.1 Uncharacterized protein ALO60_03407 [Pseudomonas amygdali pv. tabaci]